MTKETLDKIPENVRFEIELIRKRMKNTKNDIERRDVVTEYSYAYGKGLRDAGLITERERQILFVYTTV